MRRRFPRTRARSTRSGWIRPRRRWPTGSRRSHARGSRSCLLTVHDDAPLIVEGPQILPELVGPLLPVPDRALFVVAAPEVQRRLVTERGSLTYSRTRDPERARENRLRRDELLVERLLAEAAERGLPVVRVTDATETERAIERHLAPFVSAWLAKGDRGDFVARRRDENDARLGQWRTYAADVPEAAEGQVDLACECDRVGCTEHARITLVDAEAARAAARPLLSIAHR